MDIILDDSYPGFEHAKLPKEELAALIAKNKDRFGSIVLAVEN